MLSTDCLKGPSQVVRSQSPSSSSASHKLARMAAEIVQSGEYFIRNHGSGTVLELTGGSNTNCTNVIGNAKRPPRDPLVSAQRWIVTQIGGSHFYTIENAASRSMMDLTRSLPADGTPIIGYQATGKPNQQWAIARHASGSGYVISNHATGTFIDLLNGGTTAGTAVNAWGGTGITTTNTHQIWDLVPHLSTGAWIQKEIHDYLV